MFGKISVLSKKEFFDLVESLYEETGSYDKVVVKISDLLGITFEAARFGVAEYVDRYA